LFGVLESSRHEQHGSVIDDVVCTIDSKVPDVGVIVEPVAPINFRRVSYFRKLFQVGFPTPVRGIEDSHAGRK
jgi:hypothetical protein